MQVHRFTSRWAARLAGDGGASLKKSLSIALALGAGALTAYLSFAPVGWWWFAFIGMGALAYLVRTATSFSAGALIGFTFGLAYFIVGVSWVRISMHEFGNMPLALAWFSAVLFCSYLAIYPMLACAFTAWAKPKSRFFFAFVFASAWAFSEYLRAFLFTGFEWLSIGATQTNGVFSFQGFVPIVGATGVGWLIVFASALTLSALKLKDSYLEKALPSTPKLIIGFGNFVGWAQMVGWMVAWAVLAALALNVTTWGEPTGKPLRLSLLQGNIEQSLKWDPARFQATLATYEKLVREAKGELIILPETAIPNLLDRVPREYVERLQSIAKEKRANLVIGVPIEDNGKYYNAAVSFGIDPPQQYRKVHLVPFGEYMPLQGVLGWFYRNLQIPMSNFAAGDPNQPLMTLNGQTLGISICYEDAFARDVHRTLPDATLLVNISNDAWFGKSAAAEQHLQLAQLRAIEQARPMVRANNTGITAVIDAKGRVADRIPSWQTGILEATVQGAKGYTPYMVWGDLPLLIVCLAGLGIAAAQRPRRERANGDAPKAA
ncbi:MAG: apolipoprotein N-acyltransferase [Betaproteobacteria bacterium]|nr:MAG: apolipoprotein N-acyltransferase [Betaproteobacteria bacterium]